MCITIILAVSADGNKLSLYVIPNCKTTLKEQLPTGNSHLLTERLDDQ